LIFNLEINNIKQATSGRANHELHSFQSNATGCIWQHNPSRA